jgi:hypothetical protein
MGVHCRGYVFVGMSGALPVRLTGTLIAAVALLLVFEGWLNGWLFTRLHLPWTIEGVVVGQQSGRPIPGVDVHACVSTNLLVLDAPQTRDTFTTRTDEHGRFRFCIWRGEHYSLVYVRAQEKNWCDVAIAEGFDFSFIATTSVRLNPSLVSGRTYREGQSITLRWPDEPGLKSPFLTAAQVESWCAGEVRVSVPVAESEAGKDLQRWLMSVGPGAPPASSQLTPSSSMTQPDQRR